MALPLVVVDLRGVFGDHLSPIDHKNWLKKLMRLNEEGVPQQWVGLMGDYPRWLTSNALEQMCKNKKHSKEDVSLECLSFLKEHLEKKVLIMAARASLGAEFFKVAMAWTLPFLKTPSLGEVMARLLVISADKNVTTAFSCKIVEPYVFTMDSLSMQKNVVCNVVRLESELEAIKKVPMHDDRYSSSIMNDVLCDEAVEKFLKKLTARPTTFWSSCLPCIGNSGLLPREYEILDHVASLVAVIKQQGMAISTGYLIKLIDYTADLSAGSIYDISDALKERLLLCKQTLLKMLTTPNAQSQMPDLLDRSVSSHSRLLGAKI